MVSRMRGDVWVLAAASAASNTGNWAASVALALVVFRQDWFHGVAVGQFLVHPGAIGLSSAAVGNDGRPA